ncbi:serine/threonine-protein phosphatase [Rhizobium laguerreae]|uniref:PP2C family protein-serine/threonine phosphatase n=1 Tax=Rhizobium laguerreae TaxID=1076926 RepID=UPI001C907603|nr:PP2C family serine/threonine-protein phosphatase [Rhizobium laguerreae]MBY3090180.1 serine/threonine-protein phosphatase [Rhizobium laguerreae]
MSSNIAILSISAATHKGYARDGNEDSFLVDDRIGGGDFDQLTTQLAITGEPVVLAIADGLGGHKAGEVASRYAVTQIRAKLAEVDFGNDASVSELLNGISLGLHHQMLKTPALLGMGTTIVMAIVTAQSLMFANVGDSRGYLVDESGLRQTTHDDVPPNPSNTLRRTGAITQALGGMSPRTRIIPHVYRSGLPEGEWSIILCSDGVSDFLSLNEIAGVGRTGPADAMTLIDSSLRAGGQDNISAIVVRFSRSAPTNRSTA